MAAFWVLTLSVATAEPPSGSAATVAHFGAFRPFFAALVSGAAQTVTGAEDRSPAFASSSFTTAALPALACGFFVCSVALSVAADTVAPVLVWLAEPCRFVPVTVQV